MNTVQLLREAGPEAPPLSPAVRDAARAALLAEIDASHRSRTRPVRLPGRKVAVRLGIAAVTAAAAWAGAVAVTAPGEPSESVTLVDFDTPTFPFSLDPEPAGMRPAFDGTGDGASIASYEDPSGQNGFSVHVGDERPEDADESAPDHRELDDEDVTVQGSDAELQRYSRTWCSGDGIGEDCATRTFARLTWERAEDQWVSVVGHGRYGTGDAVLEVAGSLVDRPQRATLTAELAPAGWSVDFFKMGRVLGLVNDSYEQETITVHVPLPEDVIPPDQVATSIEAPAGSVVPVTVHGRPAQLVPTDHGPGMRGWFLQAQFENGTTFTLQVPDAFTQAQVVEFAEQVTYHP